MFRDVAELVKVTAESNDIDEIVEVQTSRQVYVSLRSIGQREAYEASAFGLKPSITFVLANKADYEDEQLIRFNGKSYKVIRTYFDDKDERLEIVCETIINKGRDLNANAEKRNQG